VEMKRLEVGFDPPVSRLGRDDDLFVYLSSDDGETTTGNSTQELCKGVFLHEYSV
jgi:hypothetical protein